MQTRPRTWRDRRGWAFALGAPVMLALLGWLGPMLIAGNFGTVVAGRLYRSSQPSAAQLSDYSDTLGLRSVLNLRGASPGAAWYDAELSASRELGLEHRDLPFSANREPSLEELEALVETLRRLPPPVLVHCMAGADRTGLAVALYRYAVLQQPAEEARGGLTLRYGHFPYLWSHTGAMDRGFEHYVASHPRP